MFDGFTYDNDQRAWINALMPAIPPAAWLTAVPRDATPSKVAELIKEAGLTDDTWRTAEDIAQAINVTSKALVRCLNGLAVKNGTIPKKTFGLRVKARIGRPEYRIARIGKTLLAEDVVKALRPLQQDLDRQSTAHMAEWSSATLKMCAGLLRQLLAEWDE